MSLNTPELRTTVEKFLACDKVQFFAIDNGFEGDWYWLKTQGEAPKGCEKIYNKSLAGTLASFQKEIELLVSASELASAYPEVDFSDPDAGARELWKRAL